jgi:hypothetical protein
MMKSQKTTFYFGHVDFQSQFVTRFPGWMDIAVEVGQSVTSVLKKIQPTSQRNILVREFVQVVSDAFSAVSLLIVNGYGIEAMILIRNMYENVVNCEYLVANESEIPNFLNYQWIDAEMRFKRLMASSPADAPKLTNEQLKELQDNANAVRAAFLRDPTKPKKGVRDSWCKKPLIERAISPALKRLYPWIYSIGSGIVHGNVPALMYRGSVGAKSRYAPSPDFVRYAMIRVHFLLAHILEIANATANLGLTSLAERNEERHHRLLAMTEANPDF